jgi:carbamoyltransferase
VFAEVNRNPSRSELLKFGGVLLVAGGLSAAYAHHHGHARTALCLAAAGVAVMLSAFVPALGRPLYVAWMSLGVALGRVTAPIILLFIFLVFVVPVAIAFKLRRRDTMRRTFDRTAPSYWEDYPAPEGLSSYLRQS